MLTGLKRLFEMVNKHVNSQDEVKNKKDVMQMKKDLPAKRKDSIPKGKNALSNFSMCLV